MPLHKDNTQIVSYHKKKDKQELKKHAKKKNTTMSTIIKTLVEEFNSKNN